MLNTKAKKLLQFSFFVKILLIEKKDAPENDNEDEDSGAMLASCPSSSDIMPPSSPTQ